VRGARPWLERARQLVVPPQVCEGHDASPGRVRAAAPVGPSRESAD
jgi:hypothetical protein